ncbi:MAG: MAPEG family protein [Rhodospirillales bacterium]
MTDSTVPITAFYAALLTIWFAVLSLRVIMFRRSNRVSLGTGDSPTLERRIRAQGNAAEYIPVFLILLGLGELNGFAEIGLHGFGLAFMIGRLMHGYAFSFSDGKMSFRVGGMQLTIWSLLLFAAWHLVAVAGPILAG